MEGRGWRLESGLVVTQVALAVMIASGAALLARSVGNRASREKTLDELERAVRELPGPAASSHTRPYSV